MDLGFATPYQAKVLEAASIYIIYTHVCNPCTSAPSSNDEVVLLSDFTELFQTTIEFSRQSDQKHDTRDSERRACMYKLHTVTVPL